MEDNGRFVDELLDSALAHRRDSEPRAGLEGRILARVRAASREGGRKLSRKFWLAVAATAAVVALIAIYSANRSHGPVPQASRTANAVPAPPPREALKANAEPTPAIGPATAVVEPKRIARRERKPSRRVEAHHWPSQFPTPAPLSQEEKALVRYVQQTPPQVLAEPFVREQSANQPLEIKPLKIVPLEIQPLSIRSPKEEIQ
ncbi:MAG TPA: hypothetical protein VFL79_10775 [Terriglobia bacterium]|nr:hypothetical protein [Terriglobia bacterium]